MINEAGVADIGLREVARRVGVSAAAPYRHYSSREAFLAAIAEEGFKRLIAKFDTIKSVPGESDHLLSLGLAYIEFASANKGLFKLMFGDAVRKEDFPELMQTAARAIEPLQVAVAMGSVGETRLAALLAWSMVHGYAYLAVDQQLPADLTGADQGKGLARTILSSFIDGLRRSPTPVERRETMQIRFAA